MDDLYLNIVFQSDFAIGSGFGQPGTIDNRVNRNRDDLPFLPGSSLKGVLRDHAREISLLLDQPMPSQANPTEDKESPLARLFGSPWFDAGICISSCQPDRGHLAQFQQNQVTGKTWGNRIDPEFGTVEEDFLYCREIADRQLGYWLVIKENDLIRHPLKDIDKALLVAAILRFKHLGSGKTRGRGACRLLPDDLTNWKWEDKTAADWLELLPIPPTSGNSGE